MIFSVSCHVYFPSAGVARQLASTPDVPENLVWDISKTLIYGPGFDCCPCAVPVNLGPAQGPLVQVDEAQPQQRQIRKGALWRLPSRQPPRRRSGRRRDPGGRQRGRGCSGAGARGFRTPEIDACQTMQTTSPR